MRKACICAFDIESLLYTTSLTVKFPSAWWKKGKVIRSSVERNCAKTLRRLESGSRKETIPSGKRLLLLLLLLGCLIVGVERHPDFWRQDAFVDFSTSVRHTIRQCCQELFRYVLAITVVSVNAVEEVFHLHTCILPLAPTANRQNFGEVPAWPILSSVFGRKFLCTMEPSRPPLDNVLPSFEHRFPPSAGSFCFEILHEPPSSGFSFALLHVSTLGHAPASSIRSLLFRHACYCCQRLLVSPLDGFIEILLTFHRCRGPTAVEEKTNA